MCLFRNLKLTVARICHPSRTAAGERARSTVMVSPSQAVTVTTGQAGSSIQVHCQAGQPECQWWWLPERSERPGQCCGTEPERPRPRPDFGWSELRLLQEGPLRPLGRIRVSGNVEIGGKNFKLAKKWCEADISFTRSRSVWLCYFQNGKAKVRDGRSFLNSNMHRQFTKKIVLYLSSAEVRANQMMTYGYLLLGSRLQRSSGRKKKKSCFRKKQTWICWSAWASEDPFFKWTKQTFWMFHLQPHISFTR